MRSFRKRIQKFIKRNKFLLLSGFLIFIILFNFKTIREGSSKKIDHCEICKKKEKEKKEKRNNKAAKILKKWRRKKN